MKDKIAGLRPGKENLLNYLFMGALLYRSVPYLLNVLILVITQRPVHKLLNYLLNYSGILILPLFALILWKAVGYEKKSDALSGAMMMGLAGVVNSVGGGVLADKMLVHLLEQPVIYYLLCALLQLGYITLIILALPGRKRSVKELCVSYGICIIGSVVLLGMDSLLGIFAGIIQMSFGTNIVLRAVRAMADAGILYVLLLYRRKDEPMEEVLVGQKEEAISGEVHPAEAVVTEKRGSLSCLGITCLGIVLCLVLEVVIFTENPEEGIHANIAGDIALGSMELASGNVEMAAMYYNSAWERKSVWEYVTGATDNAAVFNGASDSTLLEVRLLYWLYHENVNAMEKCLMEEHVGLDFAIELLELYATREGDLSERSRAVRKDIISLMIAADTFTDTVISPKDLEGRRYKLAERLDEMEDVKIYCDAVNLLAETGKDGGVDREKAEEMLAIAENRPEDVNLQYFAVVYGCAYKSDNATHYERTLQAGERFVALVAQSENLSFEQKYQSRMMLVDWAMELGLFEKALLYIEEVLELRETESLLITLAQCQQDLGKTQECVETAERILALNPENYGAIYYRAVGRLKDGDVDGAIEDTLKLCMLVQTLEGDARHQAEVILYDVLQYQGFSDVTYNYMIYKKLSEEQRRRIEESEFYAAYLDAVYCCFTSKDYDVALDCINRVLLVEPDLAQANYLKGCIYFGKEDFAMAAKAFEEAVAVDDTSATAWYSLANAYDAMGEYEMAYEASVKVDMLLPDTDHLFDPYGIAIHNGWLKERLAEELGIKEE